MTAAANLDPFNLAKLSETIDKQVFRIITKEFASVVNENALKALKRKLRDAISALVIEMWHDINYLQQNPKIGNILVANERIPTVAQLAEQIPTVYVEPVQTGNVDTDKQAKVQWRINQVKWVFNTWLQVYGQLIQRLADGSPIAIETTFNLDGVDEFIRVPQPSEIDIVSSAWQIVRRLTLSDRKALKWFSKCLIDKRYKNAAQQEMQQRHQRIDKRIGQLNLPDLRDKWKAFCTEHNLVYTETDDEFFWETRKVRNNVLHGRSAAIERRNVERAAAMLEKAIVTAIEALSNQPTR